MNVANGLSIGWPKLDKIHLAKIMGSQGFYVRRIHLDPCPNTDVVLKKKRGFLVIVQQLSAHAMRLPAKLQPV